MSKSYRRVPANATPDNTHIGQLKIFACRIPFCPDTMSGKLAIFFRNPYQPPGRTYTVPETLGNRRFRNEQLSESTMKRFGYKKDPILVISVLRFSFFWAPPWPLSSPLELAYLTTKMLWNHLERALVQSSGNQGGRLWERATRNWSDMIRVYSFTWRSDNRSGHSLNIAYSNSECCLV